MTKNEGAMKAETFEDYWKAVSSGDLTGMRDEAHKTAVDHGFKGASIGEEIALMHSELSEALEDHREGRAPAEVWYVNKETGEVSKEFREGWKPCGIPSEMADVIIRVLDFCGKYYIDIERITREKMFYNRSRPFRHGNKKL